jgi:hypothetical protein
MSSSVSRAGLQDAKAVLQLIIDVLELFKTVQVN